MAGRTRARLTAARFYDISSSGTASPSCFNGCSRRHACAIFLSSSSSASSLVLVPFASRLPGANGSTTAHGLLFLVRPPDSLFHGTHKLAPALNLRLRVHSTGGQFLLVLEVELFGTTSSQESTCRVPAAQMLACGLISILVDGKYKIPGALEDTDSRCQGSQVHALETSPQSLPSPGSRECRQSVNEGNDGDDGG